MNVLRARALLVSLFFSLLPISALALPGDAAAILAHCGPPSSDEILHQDTPRMTRVISYADTELVFVPESNNWSFSRATRAGMPLAQDMLFSSMHCVSDAIEEVSAAPPVAAVAASRANAEKEASETAHEHIFMTVAAILLVGVLFFAIRPYMKSEPVKRPTPAAPRAPQRRPSATGIRFAKPQDPNPSGIVRTPRNDSTNQE